MGKNCGFFTWALRFQNRLSYKITTLTPCIANYIFRREIGPARGPSRKPISFKEREQMVKAHMKLTPQEVLQNEKKVWTRSAPADLYYERDLTNPRILRSTER